MVVWTINTHIGLLFLFFVVAARSPFLDLPAVTDLGHNPFKSDLAGVLVHLLAVDLEALSELNVCVGNELLEV